jgi:hypothetical protein
MDSRNSCRLVLGLLKPVPLHQQELKLRERRQHREDQRPRQVGVQGEACEGRQDGEIRENGCHTLDAEHVEVRHRAEYTVLQVDECGAQERLQIHCEPADAYFCEDREKGGVGEIRVGAEVLKVSAELQLLCLEKRTILQKEEPTRQKPDARPEEERDGRGMHVCYHLKYCAFQFDRENRVAED